MSPKPEWLMRPCPVCGAQPNSGCREGNYLANPHPERTHSSNCSLPNCDGTRLGHELARDFPKETAAINEAMNRLAHREDYVMPENLQVEPGESDG